MYNQYFIDWDVRPEFQKEFISLWDGWLGTENLHKLDKVTETDWNRFIEFLTLIFSKYEIFIAKPDEGSCEKATSIDTLVQTYEQAMAKGASKFTRLIIKELDCVITEDWDFTYILWHKDGYAIEALAPFIQQAQLHHFGPE